ncbi:unnamed protein product [Kluyveromyces dobzhanskii CBS 2104]|uniref:WGS project CCBQ000000000 data, contig 00015 n=1 Tax=Kluyveromyces dobzhanskii CBS 2104 TaxID=1427455 RepID=A0A0A8LCK2_9SACH|nr:unnamed protein product [Kluyveromyces dobzhanskii CBS 2104]
MTPTVSVNQQRSECTKGCKTKKRKFSKQSTIFELSNSRQTTKSRAESRYTSKMKKNNTTTSGLYVGPDRTIFSIYESGKTADTRVGICIINYATAEMHVSEFIDTQVFIKTLNKVYVSQPTDILVPSHSLSSRVSKLATLLKCNIAGNVKVCEATTKVFSAQEGLEIVEKYALCSPKESPIPFEEQLVGKEFCLMAVSAANHYMSQISKDDPTLRFSNFRVKIDHGDNTMVIDIKTVRSLELIDNSQKANGMSLLKAIDNTVTKMGRRALRNDILQPLTDVNILKLRVSAAQELGNDPDALYSIRNELKNFHDLDAIFCKLLTPNHSVIPPDQKLNYVILLKESIEKATILRRIFEECEFKSKLLSEIASVLSLTDIDNIVNLVHGYINNDTHWALKNIDMQNQKAYAVKSGSNGLLDVLRQLYKSLIDDIMNEITILRDQFELNINHSFDFNRQFYLKLKKSDIDQLSELPACFINRVTKKSAYEFTTLKLMKMNTRLSELSSEMITLSEQTVSELLTTISSHISTLFMISEAISVLDLLASLSVTGLNDKWVVPNFGDHLILNESRHPILEKVLTDYVPNNVEVIPNFSSFQILTGCNMSGKSLYLKQVALLNILAQIGCSVPCNSATFPVYHKIHARVCNDSVEVNSSIFSSEMKDMAYYIDDITDRTLMILDELGRGSSISDGFSIALAISEYLLLKKATVFISTHFKDIPTILAPKPCVLHLQMKTEIDENSRLKMKYKASRNYDDIQRYGMIICKEMFSEKVILEAYKISELLKASKRKALRIIEQDDCNDTAHQNTQVKQVYYLVEKLKLICSENKAISIEELQSLQNDFISTFEII